jgi:hypothetical protein
MAKEGYDDFQRYKRDKDVNGQEYERITTSGVIKLPASDIKVGHYIKVHKNQRVPRSQLTNPTLALRVASTTALLY